MIFCPLWKRTEEVMLSCSELEWPDPGSAEVAKNELHKPFLLSFFSTKLRLDLDFFKNVKREANLFYSSQPAICSPSTLVLITGCLEAFSLFFHPSRSLLPSLCLPHRGWFMSAALGRVGWRGRDTAAEGEREWGRANRRKEEKKRRQNE